MKPDNLHSMRHLTIAAVLILALGVTRSLLARPEAAGSGNPTLRTVADIPMPGPAVRFDYQSLDQDQGRLYISHMNADQLVVFDITTRQVLANLVSIRCQGASWLQSTRPADWLLLTRQQPRLLVVIRRLERESRTAFPST